MIKLKKNKKDLNKLDINNNKKEVKVTLVKRLRTTLGISQSFLNGLGFGLIALGIYFLLAYFGKIPFTPRFENILDEPNKLLITSIALILIGGAINEKIRSIFHR